MDVFSDHGSRGRWGTRSLSGAWRWNEHNICCSEMAHQLKVWSIVWRHNEVSGITINDRRGKLSERLDCTINAISNSQEICSYTDCNILTLVNSTRFVYCSYHDRAIDAVAYLHELNVRIHVDVRILTSLNAHVLILNWSSFLNGNTFVETVHIDNLTFRLMLGDNLTEPVNNHVHMDLDLMSASLEKWSQLR